MCDVPFVSKPYVPGPGLSSMAVLNGLGLIRKDQPSVSSVDDSFYSPGPGAFLLLPWVTSGLCPEPNFYLGAT